MSAAVTNGLANFKIQLGENEYLLEERFFNEKRNCLGLQRSLLFHFLFILNTKKNSSRHLIQ